MLRCTSCSYVLTLIERRRKYKCAKCSSLFLKKVIEDREFREYNKFMKTQDKQGLKKGRKGPLVKFTKEERLERARQLSSDYYYRNKERIREKQNQYYDDISKYKKNGKNSSGELRLFRLKQGKLAEEMLENDEYNDYIDEL